MKTKEHQPWLAALEVDESRYTRAATRESTWRYVAFVLMAILAVSVGLNAWGPHKPTVVPWPILYDSLGRVLAAGSNQQQVTASQMSLLKEAAMKDFVIQLRSVTTDGIAQKGYVNRVYAHLGDNSPAKQFVHEYYRAGPPFERAQKEIVGVEVRSALPESDKTYIVEWIETTRDLYGAITARDLWKGSFTFAMSPKVDEKVASLNPLGMFIVQAGWNKVQELEGRSK